MRSSLRPNPSDVVKPTVPASRSRMPIGATVRARLDLTDEFCRTWYYWGYERYEPAVVRLLIALARDPGVVLTREQLMDRVWGYRDYGGGRVVDSHVARIRKKLEEEGGQADAIRTVHGVGYAFRETTA